MKIIVHALLALTLTAPGRALAGDPGPLRSDERGPCGQAYRVRSAGTVAYVALDSGIDILDLTNPDRPWRLAHVPLAAPVLDLAIRDGLLVAALGDAGLVLVDVDNPQAPGVRGTLAGFPARAVAVSADRAYVGEGSEAAGSDGALHIIDIANPEAPVELGVSTRLYNGATAVVYERGYAFVAVGAAVDNPTRGLAVIDVSIPLVPIEVAFVPTPEVPYDLAGGDGWLWMALANGREGVLRGLDVTLPVAPALAGYLPLGDAVRSLAVDGPTAYVAAGTTGLAVVNLVNPYAPTLESTLPTGRTACGVDAQAGSVVLAERAAVAPEGSDALGEASTEASRSRGGFARGAVLSAGVELSLTSVLVRETLRSFSR